MKNKLTAFMLTLVSFAFISCGNFGSKNPNTSAQNVNIKVSEEYADWAEVGTVQLNSNQYGGSPSSSNSVWTVKLWVKIVGDVTYYKVGRSIENAVSPRPNPNYQNDPKQLKWMVDLSVTGRTCYLNLPE